MASVNKATDRHTELLAYTPSSTQARAVTRQASLSVMQRVSRRLALKALASLSQGHLVIDERGHRHCFGDPQSSLHGVVHVHSPDFYVALLTSGTVGAGEAYMQGHWSSPDLVGVVRVMSANLDTTNGLDAGWTNLKSFALKGFHWLRENSRTGSRKNIAAHYDLGNEFFKLFLDRSMMYSAAIFESKDTSLEQAAIAKLDRICQRLQLTPDDHLLEIGTGWGGMAIHAAKHYGCRVTTTTISKEQYDYASAWVAREGLQDRITLLLKDYRDLAGQYDKLVSIEMIEAVGHKYYPTYFSTCSKLLKPQGLMLIQAITIADQRFDFATRNVDFIQRYIFPGGALPSVSVIADCVRNYTDMQLVGLEEIGLHYAETLAHWRARFWAAIHEVRACGFDEVFVRMWDFYLGYCEGGFRERAIGTGQLLMAKPLARHLPAVLPLASTRAQ